MFDELCCQNVIFLISVCCMYVFHHTGLDYVRFHLDPMTEGEQEHVWQHSSDEDNFSSVRSKRSLGTGEVDGYLACISDKMDPLNSFPIIKKLFVKLHTGLPLLCVSASLVVWDFCSLKRTRLNTNFEKQLLLKLNSKFSK